MQTNHSRLFVKELVYYPDCAHYMKLLEPLPMPVFLDSNSREHDSARYDILSALPTAYTGIKNGQSLGSEQATEGDFFKQLQALLDKYAPPFPADKPDQHDLPFSGGLLGYLGYPLLEKKGQWRINNAFFGLYQWALLQDHHLKTAKLVFQKNCPRVIQTQVERALTPEVKDNRLTARQDKLILDAKFRSNLDREKYTRAFTKIENYISAGDCYQVNLSQQFSARFSGSPFSAYLQLRKKSKNPFSAYIQWDQEALLSLSPERFISHRQGLVSTEPIKGTRPRGDTEEADLANARELLNSEKDKAENLMIVDLLRNDLGTSCVTGSVTVEKLFELQSFTAVHHLVSTIKGRLRPDVKPLELLKNCFPGGSITGAPKLRAMEIIQELEPHQRGIYCGTLAYVDFNGNMDSNIIIRSIHCDRDEIRCWAGGGIVADSICQQEYQECLDKVSRLLETLETGS